MATLILVFLVFSLAMAGLGLGVMLGRAPIKGSCGGLSCGGACTACPRSKTRKDD